MMRPIFSPILTLVAGLFAATLLLAPSAFAQDNYSIRAGDILRIEVLEDPSLNRSALVSPDGRISMALAGAVQAAGRTVEDVQAELSQRLASNFAAAPSVFVAIEKLAEVRASTGGGGGGAPAAPPSITVHVIGEAPKAGKLAVSPGTTMLQLFAEMGGFSKFAATKRIQLRRADASGTQKVYRFNYDAIEAGTSDAGNTVVQSGDVIVIPQRRLFE